MIFDGLRIPINIVKFAAPGVALALNAGSNIRKCRMLGCSVTTDVDHDDHGHRMSYPRYPLVMTYKKLLKPWPSRNSGYEWILNDINVIL